MARIPLCVLLVCAWASAANAATIQATGCSRGEVSAAVSAAGDGDTVAIPAGTCTWTSNLTISNKSITVKGAGVGVTTIIDGISAPGSGAKPPVLTWSTKSSGVTRLTDLTFNGGSSGGQDQSFNTGVVSISGGSSQFRLDHITFANLSRTAGLRVMGNVTGVIDHVTFDVVGGYYGIHVFHNNWMGVAGGYGDSSWAQPNVWGSSAFLFVEDCQFIAPPGGGVNWGSDGWMGQRVVYRRNTYTNLIWANHGTETSGRERGARASEVYQNTFVLNNAGWNSALCCVSSVIGTRGGTSLVWGNAVLGSNGGGAQHVFDIANLRSNDPRPFYLFNHCDGFNAWDQNAGPELGYRCIDQPGAGQGDLLTGDYPTPVWLRQQLEPIYVWSNTINGTRSDAVTNGSIPVVENRDFYNQVSPFTGARGVGQGTIAQRPGSCTTGVAYWATNEGEWDSTNGSTPDGRLYRCTSTNAWTLWYTPAAYPHPLATGGGAPSGPTTVTASQSDYTPTQPIAASFANASGSATDWIGVFAAGAANTAHLQWLYLNGSQTPSGGVVSGTIAFPSALATPGNYEVRLFLAGTYTVAASGSFTVSIPSVSSISTSSPTYAPSQPIVATFAGASGNPRDWIGLYAAGASNSSMLQWLFVNGTTTPTTGRTNGTVTFSSGIAPPGNYEVRLFLNDSYVLAASAAFTVQVASSPTIAPGKATYLLNEPIAATFANASGSARDWIGVYAAGASNASFLRWAYLNGSQTATTALTSGTVTFTSGLASPGSYELRLFLNDTYTVQAFATFTVQAAAVPTVVPDKTQYGVNKPITVTFTNTSGSALDWIGLYAAGAPHQSFMAWMYVNGSMTSTTGVVNGSVTFSSGLPTAASYEVRLFRNGTYTLDASAAFTVQATALPTIVPDKTQYGTNQPIVATFTNTSGSPRDWIGLYAAGASNQSFVAWMFVNGTTTPTTGVVNGTVTFPNGVPTAGAYELRLFRNDTYTLDASASFTVQDGTTIVPNKTLYGPNKPITATFTNASGSARDWIGLYAAGAASQSMVAWVYVSGSKTATTGVVNGSVTFSSGAPTAGAYEVRLFRADTYTVDASASFTVQVGVP